jgi:predicted transcriptional regulator
MSMKLSEIRKALDAEIIVGHDKLDLEITGGAASDLMSDLLRNPKRGALMLTGLSSSQVIRTAIIADMTAVVLVRGKTPDTKMTELARAYELPLLTTPFNMYSSVGILYGIGLRSIR